MVSVDVLATTLGSEPLTYAAPKGRIRRTIRVPANQPVVLVGGGEEKTFILEIKPKPTVWYLRMKPARGLRIAEPN